MLPISNCITIVKAQDSTFPCGVPDIDTTEFTQLPWFDNNQLLEDFLDSVGYPSSNKHGKTISSIAYDASGGSNYQTY